ncbi:MAG: ATP-dependent 6-phosphofructokinase [Myxococcales bacterium]|nr:ATP-dependent 6-phosphofructokinase [Myxococcales bacterium]
MSGPSLSATDLQVSQLGECLVPSPLRLSSYGDTGRFVADGTGVPTHVEVVPGQPNGSSDVAFEKAGPRASIYFDPSRVRAAVVTCGGLCPGLNNVIRSLTLQLHYGYGVKEILGLRYGYRGLDPVRAEPPLLLNRDAVGHIHRLGGSILGTSRGPVPPELAIAQLRRLGVNVLFTIGGDGTQRGAHAIALEAQKQGYALAVVGVPKTIDNDIPYVWRSFGYFTAIERSREIIECAHNEAIGHEHGVGLVRLMGREAGFVAAGATLASQEVNFALIPEVPFILEGEGGFLAALRRRLGERKHAVVVVAEGAGQEYLQVPEGLDASGNGKLADIGVFLRDRIKEDARAHNTKADVKYFDPAYYIRSVAANSEDALYCDQLARCAVHAAMAGKTDMLVGLWYNVITHVPIALAVNSRKRITLQNDIWHSVLQTTGQPTNIFKT